VVSSECVTVIGGGLAGAECAYQLARRGHRINLLEQKPSVRSPAHRSDHLAELVCSNSFRSDNPHSAIGMLHRELRALGSVILECADIHRVPAGDALAVDRERFSAEVETRIRARALGIEVGSREVTSVPQGIVVIATGPLTSDALAHALAPVVGSRLSFYDALAPIVLGDSVDMTVAFRASRYGKGGGADYLNLPLAKEEYLALVAELRAGKKVPPHAFEEPKYFEGCLPIEVMAERGDDVLAFGPMKPVGLVDPRTGARPYAVVQLRREDAAGTAWNLVGFQTRLTWPEQRRIFQMIPGLANAEWVRLGQIHRNTFIDAPRLLDADLSVKSDPRLFFAGQIAGVEGYVESAAGGLLVALSVSSKLEGRQFDPPPATTALGALYRHLTGAARPAGAAYQPTNVVFNLFPPLPKRLRAQERRQAYAERGARDFASWASGGPSVASQPAAGDDTGAFP
jgi:methylenetetrahydrofolate--tRNA-(uracil-5-)-methyltransferase